MVDDNDGNICQNVQSEGKREYNNKLQLWDYYYHCFVVSFVSSFLIIRKIKVR